MKRELKFEPLEQRRLLAADLEIVAVDFTNALGELAGAAPTVGEKVYVRAHYRITDLEFGDQYTIRYEMDGVATDQSGFFGFPGTAVDLFWYHGGWIAQPGASHSITVTIDADDAVAEANESNNSFTLAPFTPLEPTSLLQKFATPLAGSQNVDWVLSGYVDVNPLGFFEDPNDFFADYQGNTTATRDFHNGLDFAVANFAAADAGVEVLAAADGEVIEVRDGFFDRQTELTFADPGNYVFVDHGNGWVTQYYHLRRDSISVGVGELVSAGDPLGLVGSSGNSGGPHLHFEIQHNHTPVDPFADPTAYFVDPLPYIYDPALPHNLLIFGVTNDIYDGEHTFFGPSGEHLLEEVSSIDLFPTEPQEVYAYAIFTSVRAGDTWEAQLYRPDGSLVVDFDSAVFFEDRPTDGGWYRPGFTENIPGTWRVDFLYNEVKIGEQTFEVGTAAPEIRVFDATEADEANLIDGRQTPLEFGAADFNGDNVTNGRDYLAWARSFGKFQNASRAEGDANLDGAVGALDLAQWESGFRTEPPTRTFRVENHGYGDLIITGLDLPSGYSLVEGLSGTIAAGASDTFTVQLDLSPPGAKTGELAIHTNDADEAAFELLLEGRVAEPISVIRGGEIPPFDFSLFYGNNSDFDDALWESWGLGA